MRNLFLEKDHRLDEEFIRQFAEHQRAIYGIIRTLCRRPQDADDIFQETVIVLWRKRTDFEPGSCFIAWASAVARLEVLSYARRQSKSVLVFDDELTQRIAEHAAQSVSAEPRLVALRRCLQTLSDRQRTLVERRYEKGGSVKILAQRLNRSVNSISVTLHTIRKHLLECVERRLAGDVE